MKETPIKKTGSFRRYNTLEGANRGAQMIIKGLDGKDTEDWIKVRGIDSDAFQKASRAMRREILAYLEDKGDGARVSDEYLRFTFDQQRKLQASIVMEWSFDEPCTEENVIELFKSAPYIAEQVDAFSSKRERFAAA